MQINESQFSGHDMSKLIKGTVVPRPIAWVSTISASGVPNIAPFSFYTVASLDPVILCFSIGEGEAREKDTLANIIATEVFAIHVVTEEHADAMHETSLLYDAGISEFEKAGLEMAHGCEIPVPKIKAAPVVMECRLEQIVPVGTSKMVFGRLVHYESQDNLFLAKDKINPEVLKPVGRMAGDYAWIREFYSLPKKSSIGKDGEG